MHKFLDKIKSIESKPKIIKEFLNKKEIENFQELYEKLPIEINNKRQKIIKKKWSETYFPDLQSTNNTVILKMASYGEARTNNQE